MGSPGQAEPIGQGLCAQSKIRKSGEGGGSPILTSLLRSASFRTDYGLRRPELVLLEILCPSRLTSRQAWLGIAT